MSNVKASCEMNALSVFSRHVEQLKDLATVHGTSIFLNDLIVEKLFEASGFYIDVSVRLYIDIMSAGAFCRNVLLQLFVGFTVG